MESRIAQAIGLTTHPVAVIFANEKPDGAQEFAEGKWGCAISMLTAVARKGITAAISRERLGCNGAGVGLCLGSKWDVVPGGIEYFLSTGRGPGFPEGEGYKKTPELARTSVEAMPVIEIGERFVVFRPLSQLEPTDRPTLVSFVAEPDQLGALLVLANYRRPGNENVIAPFASGCSSVCAVPYREARSERPRAVLGCFDVSARPFMPWAALTFTVPYAMFAEMEEDVPGSFLERSAWKQLRERRARTTEG